MPWWLQSWLEAQQWAVSAQQAKLGPHIHSVQGDGAGLAEELCLSSVLLSVCGAATLLFALLLCRLLLFGHPE